MKTEKELKAEREKADRDWRWSVEVRPLTSGQRLRRVTKPAHVRMATCDEVEAYSGEGKLKSGDYIEVGEP